MRYFKKIEGERVYLSPINIEDAEKYTEWLNDLEITVNLSMPHKTYTLEQEKEALKTLSQDGYNYAIVNKEDNKLLGNCGLMNVDLINRIGEVGIFIGNKEFWNKGYGTEAMRLLLDYAFNLLNLNNIELKAYAFNKRAIKCYQKCGFKEIGIRRQAHIIAGEKYDEIYMDILASEFEGEIPDLVEEKINRSKE